MTRGITFLMRWTICWMILFILQKMYFMLMTWHEGTTYTDMLDVVWHGLQLDIAVAGYTILLPWLFVMLIPQFRLTGRILKVSYFLFATLASLMFVADASLYPFWQSKLDSTVFLYIDKPGDAMASVTTTFILQRIVWFVVWLYVSWRITRLLRLFDGYTSDCNTTTSPKKFSIPNIALSIVSAAIIFIAIRGGIGEGTNNVSAAYYSDNQYLNHCAVNPVFSMIYTIDIQQDFSTAYPFFPEDERKEIMEGIYHTESIRPDTLLNTQRPDIILVVWEGLCEQMVGAIGGNAEVTPHLNALAKEGILFSRCYANSYRTDRGLVSIMAGFLGFPNVSLMKLPDKADKLPALPRSLANAGYTTTFWYGGDIMFTNMRGYMYQAGFKRTFSDKDFTHKERSSEWGVPDEHLFRKMSKDYCTSSASPSFDAIMTLSSHEPWDVPTHRLKAAVPNSFNYTDGCLGEFISELKKSPRWANTLVIITGDHGVMASPDATRYGHPTIHLPMIWLGGAVRKPMVIDRLMCQSDLAATLLGQLNIPHADFPLSRDVMSKGYTYPTATHCYSGGITFIDSTGITTYDIDAQKSIVNHDPLRERKAKATLQTAYRTVSSLNPNP